MSIFENIYEQIDARYVSFFAPLRTKKLKNTHPTIISNNCWAGSVYRYYGLPYSSPTAGLYFFPDDYLRLCYNLRWYMGQELKPLSFNDARHKRQIEEKGQKDVPLGLLGELEIVFLHYPTFEEAAEKWARRVSRINWNDVRIKFSEMNGCSYHELRLFDELPFENKVLFTVDEHPELKSARHFKGYENVGQILNDTTFFRKYLNLGQWMNSDPRTYPENGYEINV